MTRGGVCNWRWVQQHALGVGTVSNHSLSGMLSMHHRQSRWSDVFYIQPKG